ncbi:hypothetical protein D8682_05905 [Buttiauxella sp. 3AFRM03]|uniref:hypothetical protein n=1 Tax=Buttiauxella sp. 3AFRM03 TaxID=2479367 RepID=UPI000EF839BC|nr:hypothetical protein [Buttiauxella sp. 3AFRM03]AYN26565.1 hypothetical protein D8682_05905 [Buttiauxella sp. 3AFRM03]
MKLLYAELINNLLQDYYFNIENNPKGQESHFVVLTNGIQHLHGLAFCLRDTDSVDGLRPFVTSIMNHEVPRPSLLGGSI